MSEILTIQIGNASNYVGSHFWNFQDEYSMRVNEGEAGFRDEFDFNKNYLLGETRSGERTYTPRVVIIDTSENLETLCPAGSSRIGADSASEISSQKIELHEAEKIERHPFQDALDFEDIHTQSDNLTIQDISLTNASVRTWPDFLKVKLHPRSICHLPNIAKTNYFHGLFGASVSSQYSIMTAAMVETITESIRHQLEACDSLQGICLLSDGWDMSIGISTSLLTDFIADECPQRRVLFNIQVKPDNNHVNPLLALGEVFKTSSHVTALWSYANYQKQEFYSKTVYSSLEYELLTQCNRLRADLNIRMDDSLGRVRRLLIPKICLPNSEIGTTSTRDVFFCGRSNNSNYAAGRDYLTCLDLPIAVPLTFPLEEYEKFHLAPSTGLMYADSCYSPVGEDLIENVGELERNCRMMPVDELASIAECLYSVMEN